MKEENKNGQSPEKEQLLSSLRNAEEMYVFMSLCTKMPYVLCDEETFDDEVLLYYTEEDAQREGKKLIEQRIPIQIAKIEKKQLLGFFSSLYPMGVNGLVINKNMESEARLQLGELVIRPNTEDLPDGKVWVENPQLHLTSLYFMQEMRRQEKPELTEELKGLQEEILVNYGRGRFIVAVHKENGMPMLKQKNGDAYQPIFTDILEFRKFNKEDQFKTMAIEAKNVPKMLVNEAKGVVINPYGVNLQIPIVRPEEPQEKKIVVRLWKLCYNHDENKNKSRVEVCALSAGWTGSCQQDEK